MSKQIANQKAVTEQLNALNNARGKKATIEQVISTVRSLPVHKANLNALGLRGINKKREHVITPQIEGMLRKVIHMVKISEVS